MSQNVLSRWNCLDTMLPAYLSVSCSFAWYFFTDFSNGEFFGRCMLASSTITPYLFKALLLGFMVMYVPQLWCITVSDQSALLSFYENVYHCEKLGSRRKCCLCIFKKEFHPWTSNDWRWWMGKVLNCHSMSNKFCAITIIRLQVTVTVLFGVTVLCFEAALLWYGCQKAFSVIVMFSKSTMINYPNHSLHLKPCNS